MLLGFKPRFVDPILIGTKVHTIRGKRKIEPKIGEQLHMYTGLRTKHCRLITKKETLVSTQKVWIKIVFRLKPFEIIELLIHVDGRALSLNEIEQFCKFDGFENSIDFVKYWVEGCKKEINQKKLQNKLCQIVESNTLYHWTDLKY